MNQETKFCRDCRFGGYAGKEWSATIMVCANPKQTPHPNHLVTGNQVDMWGCVAQRAVDTSEYCGPEARWFEPKEPTP